MARSITTRRSKVIAVILATDTNLQYPELLAEISRATSLQHYRVMLFTLDAMENLQATLDQLWSYQADGVLAAVRLSDAQIAHLEDHGVPVVLFNRKPEGRAVGSVSCDHEACGQLLAEHLIASGHRRIALIDGPPASTVAAERLHGLRSALRGADIQTMEARGDFSYASGQSAMTELAASRRPSGFSAVVAANDMMAIGAMDRARHGLGLRVPEDVRFAGFDGIQSSQWDSYRLTTVRQPIRAMSEAAAALLMDRLAGKGHPAERRVFPGELIVGFSTQTVRTAARTRGLAAELARD